MSKRTSFVLILTAFILGAILAPELGRIPTPALADQTYTADCFSTSHTASTDLQNMENNFAALRSSFSGTTAPSNTVAGMWWYDTTENILKIRNEADNAWLNVYNFDSGYAYANTVVSGTGISVSGTLNTGNVTVGLSSGGVGATQLANGGVSQAKLATYTAGDLHLITGTSTVTPSSSNTKRYEIRLDRGGTLRIKFTIAAGGSSGSTTARIYRNGSPVGTSRTINAPGGVGIASQAYSEDISGWAAGDLVQLYDYTTASMSGGAGPLALYTGNWYTLEDMYN